MKNRPAPDGARRGAAALLALIAGASAFAAEPAPLPPPDGCEMVGREAEGQADPLPAAFPPVQLEIRTPFEPSVFRAGARDYLVYELRLQNFSGAPLRLEGVEVIAADGERLVSLTGPRLLEKRIPAGASGGEDKAPLAAGGIETVLVCLALAEGRAIPATLRHRVHLDDAVAEGPAIGTRHTQVKVLGPPVSGPDWIADNGLSISRHHRPGLIVAGGLAQISRRYAIDWKRRLDGEFFSGDARDVRAYHAYGQPVLAVADGTVVRAVDGLPDNIPRTAEGFSPAVPITMDTVAGNAVVLDIGDGQYAYYAHLKPGSVRVKAGDRVRRGQALAQIGNSGDARWPHLHFQVTHGPDILASEGVPFVIDRFRMKLADGRWSTRIREFPLDTDVIDFGAGEPTRAAVK